MKPQGGTHTQMAVNEIWLKFFEYTNMHKVSC